MLKVKPLFAYKAHLQEVITGIHKCGNAICSHPALNTNFDCKNVRSIGVHYDTDTDSGTGSGIQALSSINIISGTSSASNINTAAATRTSNISTSFRGSASNCIRYANTSNTISSCIAIDSYVNNRPKRCFSTLLLCNKTISTASTSSSSTTSGHSSGRCSGNRLPLKQLKSSCELNTFNINNSNTTSNCYSTNSHETGEAKTSDAARIPHNDTDKSGGSKPGLKQDGVQLFHNAELSSWDKKMLVMTKTYPDYESIPDRVPVSKIKTSHDRMRVKVATYMVIGTLLVCLGISINGSRKKKLGTGIRMEDHANEQLGITKK